MPGELSASLSLLHRPGQATVLLLPVGCLLPAGVAVRAQRLFTERAALRWSALLCCVLAAAEEPFSKSSCYW